MSVQLLKSLSIMKEHLIPRMPVSWFQRGSSITGVIDLGWVPFSELFSTFATWLIMSISHT